MKTQISQFSLLLSSTLTPEQLLSLRTRLNSIVEDLELEYNEFSMGKVTREDWIQQELPYIRTYGMTALNAGYCGLAKTNQHLN